MVDWTIMIIFSIIMPFIWKEKSEVKREDATFFNLLFHDRFLQANNYFT